MLQTNLFLSISTQLIFEVHVQDLIIFIEFFQFNDALSWFVFFFNLIKFFAKRIRFVFKYFAKCDYLLLLLCCQLFLNLFYFTEVKQALCLCSPCLSTGHANYIVGFVRFYGIRLVKYPWFWVQSDHLRLTADPTLSLFYFVTLIYFQLIFYFFRRSTSMHDKWFFQVFFGFSLGFVVISD